MNKYPLVFVLGLTANGLSVIRNLSMSGIKVIGIDSSYLSPGFYTKYAKCYILKKDPLKNDIYWKDFLLSIEKKHNKSTKKAVIFPTSDRYVVFLAKNRIILSNNFLFNLPSNEVLNTSIDRIKLYNFARILRIPTPKTILVKTNDDINSIPERIGFPCILRSSESHTWRQYFKNKLVVLRSNEEASEVYNRVSNLKIELILQELIPGPDNFVYDFMCYLNQHSEPLGTFLARKLRQYPIEFGVGSFDIGEYQNYVIDTSLTLLRKLHYTGMAGIEFKWDGRDNKFKLLEINPRTSLQGELAVSSGVNLPLIAYQDIIGNTVKPILNFTEGIKWLNLELDFYSFVSYLKKDKLSFTAWLNSLKGKKVFAYFLLKDPLPALVSFIKLIYKICCSFVNILFTYV